MYAMQVNRFGGPEALEWTEMPDPALGPGEALIEVAYADVLSLDAMIRRGKIFKPRLPYVPGGGVSGYVVTVGDGVDRTWLGRRVVARTPQSGGYAGLAVGNIGDIVEVPDQMRLDDAAALIFDGVTAMAILEETPIRPGDWVLVNAAAGGLGLLLVQLAHAAGAKVIGAARGETKLRLVREAGADAAIDYSNAGWPDDVLAVAGGRGPGLVLDGAGGEVGRAAFDVTAAGGLFFAYGAPSGEFAPIDAKDAARRGIDFLGIDRVQLRQGRIHELTERALKEAIVGRIRPVIGQTFKLSEAQDAHAAIEGRQVIGKTLLVADGDFELR